MERLRFLLDARSETNKLTGKQQLEQTKWNVVEAPGSKPGVTVLTVWTNKKHNNAFLWMARHCTLDKTDQKRNTQRKKQRE